MSDDKALRLQVYHGTYFDWPEPFFGRWDSSVFYELDSGYNDDGVVYVSQGRAVAEHFTTYRMVSPDDGVRVIFKGEVELKNPFYYPTGGVHEVEIGGEPYDWPMEREDLYAVLERAGHDACIAPGNYGEDGDDIALINATPTWDRIEVDIDGRWFETDLSEDPLIEALRAAEFLRYLKRPASVEELLFERDEIRRAERSSSGLCHLVSEWLEDRFGLRRRAGVYLAPDGEPIAMHYWNELADGTIVDLTADQFLEGHPFRVIRPSEAEFERYRDEWYPDYYPGHPDHPELTNVAWSGEFDVDRIARLHQERGERWWVEGEPPKAAQKQPGRGPRP